MDHPRFSWRFIWVGLGMPAIALIGLVVVASSAALGTEVNFSQVAVAFKTYCSGCHNDSEGEADFSVASYEALRAFQSDSGSLIVEGDPDGSRLYQLIAGDAAPSMPPEDQPQPGPEEVELIRQWILQGARPPGSIPEPSNSGFEKNRVRPAELDQQYCTSAASVGRDRLAMGRYGAIQFVDWDRFETQETIQVPRGKVTALRMNPSGNTLIAGVGRPGVDGQVLLIDVQNKFVLSTFGGHDDCVYAVAASSDGRYLASGGFDRTIIIREIASGQEILRLTGHNGAITDLDFHPNSELLASASADQTVKLWHVPSGQRLDTLGQPEGEMHCVRFSPDGSILFAAGADRQIRSWKLLATNSVAINPMLQTRYAHENAVLELDLWDENVLVSSSADGSLKAWSIPDLHPLGTLVTDCGLPIGVFRTPDRQAVVINLMGNIQFILPEAMDSLLQNLKAAEKGETLASHEEDAPLAASMRYSSGAVDSSSESHVAAAIQEVEPNDTLATAMRIELPTLIEGAIYSEETQGQASDVDRFLFTARSGEPWIFEIRAARDQSPLDSLIDILDSEGRPLIQTRLQAIRKTYFTFRGKDSSTSDDFRLHRWEDIELDEYLLANSEVTRMWLYPRGPDSGFKVYPGSGARHTYFGTTPVAHALGDTAYVVRPLAKDESPLPNGLPVFPVYFENDDDPTRERGADSLLMFQAPSDGDFVLRVRDARNFSGPEFRYQLVIRRPQPDYKFISNTTKLAVPRGSGREWAASVQRRDGMQHPIQIELHGLPSGVLATNPIIIEEGQYSALGTIFVSEDVPPTTEPLVISMTARVLLPDFDSRDVGPGHALWAESRELSEKIQLSITEAVEPRISLVLPSNPEVEVDEFIARPGQTVSAILRLDRNGLAGQVGFGKEDAGRNLPHGAFVDNIGLNGLLITEDRSERELFIRVAPKVKPGRRQFHFRSESAGNPTSKPIWLVIQE